jgi:hypothetical protein
MVIRHSSVDPEQSAQIDELAFVEDGESGYLLPLGVRSLAGTPDFADVHPGVYVFRVSVLDKGREIPRQQNTIEVVQPASGPLGIKLSAQPDE